MANIKDVAKLAGVSVTTVSGSVSFSPRGDWRMPSDAVAKLWLDEVELLQDAGTDVAKV